MNWEDPLFSEKDRAPTTRQRTSARIGTQITCHGGALEVVAIGPFTYAASAIPVVFQARSIGGGLPPLGSIVETPWGVCEIVD
jgi:hypothetical protein